MLPAEILALVLVASRAHGFPQIIVQPIAANTTISGDPFPSNTGDQSSPTYAVPTQHEENSTDGFENTSTTTSTITTKKPPMSTASMEAPVVVPSQGGFEDTTIGRPTPPLLIVKTDPGPSVIVSNKPSIVGVYTRTENGPNAPASASSQPTSGSDLLADIISRIGEDAGNSNPPAQITPAPASGVAGITGPQSTAVLGALMTLGGTTLTLTPGLSTTVGEGSTATVVAITTDSAGHTIITLSSSGTAVVATVTNAPTTVTLEGTGFAAQRTDSAGQAVPGSSRATSTTSSTAGAMLYTGDMNMLYNIVMGIVGFGLIP